MAGLEKGARVDGGRRLLKYGPPSSSPPAGAGELGCLGVSGSGPLMLIYRFWERRSKRIG